MIHNPLQDLLVVIFPIPVFILPSRLSLTSASSPVYIFTISLLRLATLLLHLASLLLRLASLLLHLASLLLRLASLLLRLASLLLHLAYSLLPCFQPAIVSPLLLWFQAFGQLVLLQIFAIFYTVSFGHYHARFNSNMAFPAAIKQLSNRLLVY
jgi:hypothetical protein